MLHSGIRASRSFRPGFCDFICFLVYAKCVNIVDTIFFLIVICCCNREMDGRNDCAIDDALTTLAQVLQAQQNPQVKYDESHGHDYF